MSFYRTLQVLGLSFGMMSVASAAVVYSDNFEDEAINAYPSIGGSNVGTAPYFVFNSTGNATNSLGVYSVVANPLMTGNTSSQVLRGVRDNSVMGGAVNQLRTIAKFASNGTNTNWLINGLDLSFDFLMPTGQAGGTTTESARVQLVYDGDASFTGSTATAQRGPIIHNVVGSTTGIGGANQNTGSVGPTGGLLTNTWYRYNVRFTLNDNPASTTSTQYNVAVVLTNLADSSVNTGSFTQVVSISNSFGLGLQAAGLMIETQSDQTGPPYFTAYYDNFSVVAIPEPAAVAFMGLASVGGVLVWWKRR